MAWASIEDVEQFTAAPADAVMQEALDASLAWCNRMRPDLDPDGIVGADITRAVTTYAALLWREKASPQGYAIYPEVGGDVSAADAMWNVRRLLGIGKPVAR